MKVPKGAKKVFEGVRADIYQWNQKLFDGSVATFERIHRVPTVTVIAVFQGKVVILDEEQPAKLPFVSLPGGVSDKKEEVLSAAKRELLEETGLRSNDWIKWKTLGSRGYHYWENIFFLARSCKKGAEQTLDPGEKITVRLVDFEEFLMVADDETFRNRDFALYLYRMRLDKKLKEGFRKLLKI